ncbi:hypothetical protein [Vibrio sp. Vb339]|uniref:hypothetical protein n=1 Tax=Vibrio sp. Vb339 TaxID=1192013 RepID=UPI0020A69F00|nr:hypothetical protein [Vibrio sp. Vb339]
MDPYARPCPNKNTLCAELIKLGRVIQGENMGKVVESNSLKYQVGKNIAAITNLIVLSRGLEPVCPSCVDISMLSLFHFSRPSALENWSTQIS